MNEWLRSITLWQLLKAGGLVFLYCLMTIVIVSFTLAVIEAFS